MLFIVGHLPDLSTAKLAVRALPTLVADAGAIDALAVDAGVGAAIHRRQRQRRGGGGGSDGGGGAYVHQPAGERRP